MPQNTPAILVGTEQWMDGIVVPFDGGLAVLADDGLKYVIPRRDHEGVNEGDRVQFVPRQGAFRRKRWSKKLLLRP